MKKLLLIGLVVLILILDWLALDDITTGKEQNFLMEYAFILISTPLLITLGYFLFRITRRTIMFYLKFICSMI